MQFYRSKPQQVQAMQWTGKDWSKVKAWFDGLGVEDAALRMSASAGTTMLVLKTELLEAVIKPTDWIICNGNGVVFMAHNGAFLQHYHPVDEVLNPNGGTNERPLGD